MTPTSPTITDSITSSKSKGRLVALIVSIIAGVLLGVTCLAKWLVGKGKQKPKINHLRFPGSITYMELWEMCSQSNDDKNLAKALTQFLLGDDCQLVIPPKDMYNGLCRWKEKTEERKQWSQLSKNSSLLKAVKDYRSKQGEISEDDISHICWSVAKQPQRIEKLLNTLGIETPVGRESQTKRAKVEKCSTLLTEWAAKYTQSSAETQRTSSHFIEGGDTELRQVSMQNDQKTGKKAMEGKREEEKTLVEEEREEKKTPVEGEREEEKTPIKGDRKEEQTTGKRDRKKQTTVKGKANNVKVALCLALENSGYKEVAKTFFQISETNKEPLDIKEDIETGTLTVMNDRALNEKSITAIALAITKRHFESLSRETHMKPEDIDARNRENLEWLFRTDKMLEDWVSSQECSNYEIRCRLRDAAQRCDREDVADICIEEDQCAIYDEKEPSLFIQNEQRKTSGKEDLKNDVDSITDLSNAANTSLEDTPSERTALLSQTKDQKPEETEENSCSNESKQGEHGNKNSVEGESVSSISIDEIQLIRKYGDQEAVRRIAEDLKLDNPGSVHDMDIVQALEREREGRRAGQRKRIRKAMKKTNPRYEKLLVERKYRVIFKAEIPRLAIRLLMTDVYPFAKSLGYSIRRLRQFQVDHSSKASKKGTNEFIRQHYEKEKTLPDYQARTELPKLLKKYGYKRIARTFCLDYEVSTSDLMAVATRIEPAMLAQMLGIDPHTETQTLTGDKIEDNMKMLTEWRKMMCPPYCNHRTALADIMHYAGYKHVAVGILIGDFRDCVPSKEVLRELAHQIPPSESGRLCKVLGVRGEETGVNNESDVFDLLVRWVKQGKENLWNPLADPSKQDFLRKKQGELSNKVYEAGFIDLANEIQTGIRYGDAKEFTIT